MSLNDSGLSKGILMEHICIFIELISAKEVSNSSFNGRCSVLHSLGNQ
jgi:hypothetical protein